MSITVITRATLGHASQVLTAGKGTVLAYAAMVGPLLLRSGA